MRETVNIIADCNGYRMSLVTALVEGVSHYWNTNIVDVHNLIEKDPLLRRRGTGTSKLNIKNNNVNILIQTHKAWVNDAHLEDIIYLHIDGARDISPNQISYSLRTYSGTGRHDYICSTEKHRNIIPFVLPGFFNPNRKKDIFMKWIPRDIPFMEYKDQLERSVFTWIFGFDAHPYQLGRGALSKRVFEAIACKTIPVVVCYDPSMFYKCGFDDDMIYFVRPSSFPYPFDTSLERIEYMRERGYKFVMKYHTIAKRMKIINHIIRRIINGKSKAS